MKSGKPRKIELLAPAGGAEAGLAALQYGADAVYLGLRKFSARADAANFALDELDSLVGYAHSLSPARRVFVTLNTLVLQDELGGVAQALGAVADVGADAVIVQDLGVLRLARRHFPELELHASTQLAVHDRAGVEALARLGFRRVTLARELTLDEIRECARVPEVEVETFLHGALCYSYSGLCLLSSHQTGRSGNRGRCAYPCRDRWRVEKLCGEGEGLPDGPQAGFAFSMKDLALPDHVAALERAGVACLKIEGRKKSPLYVATTVDYYRGLIDGRVREAERPDREADLKAVFSRPWTQLFVKSNRDKDVADREFVGHRGVPIGTVERVVRAGKTVSVRFATARALSRYDGLQIDIPGLDRPFGFGVSDLKTVPGSKRERPMSLVEVEAGTRVDVPLPDDYPTIPEGAAIYCSSSQRVKNRFKVAPVNLKAHRTRLALALEAKVAADGLALTAKVPARGVGLELRVEGPFDAARDASKMESAARGAFEKLGDTRFALESLRWADPEGRFVPVSKLNEARRALTEQLEPLVRQVAETRVRKALEDCHAGATALAPAPVRWSIKVDRLEALAELGPGDFAGIEELVLDVGREPLDGIAERVAALESRSGARVRIALPMVARGWEHPALEAKIRRLREAGCARWEAANVSAWARLEGDVLDLTADWSLYVLNRQAAAQLLEMGAARVTLSPEDGLENMRALLAELGDRATVVAYQDTPLFISESCPYATLRGGCPGPARCRYEQMELTSSYGGRVVAINDRCRTWVVNAVPFSLADRLRELAGAGARNLRADFVHKPYDAAEVASIFRRLRSGEPVPGHRGNFERGLARE